MIITYEYTLILFFFNLKIRQNLLEFCVEPVSRGKSTPWPLRRSRKSRDFSRWPELSVVWCIPSDTWSSAVGCCGKRGTASFLHAFFCGISQNYAFVRDFKFADGSMALGSVARGPWADSRVALKEVKPPGTRWESRHFEGLRCSRTKIRINGFGGWLRD